MQLCGGQVDVGHHFSAGVLHLETRVELQEVEAAVLAVEILHGASAHVAHHLSELHRTLEQGKTSGQFMSMFTTFKLTFIIWAPCQYILSKIKCKKTLKWHM